MKYNRFIWLVLLFMMGCDSSPLNPIKDMSASVLKGNPNKNRTVEQVTKACREKTEQRFASILQDHGLPFPPKNIELLAFKEERKLEIYANKILLHTHNFTAYSGKRGPKTKEGDRQIPEGVYGVEYLNPNSKFHISIKINYPNKRDLERAQHAGITNQGSDIFIHGKDLSIGCIAIGDAYIEEVFTLVSMVGTENVRVLIFPNDARKNGKFLPCEVCPADVDELYTELKSELVKY